LIQINDVIILNFDLYFDPIINNYPLTMHITKLLFGPPLN